MRNKAFVLSARSHSHSQAQALPLLPPAPPSGLASPQAGLRLAARAARQREPHPLPAGWGSLPWQPCDRLSRRGGRRHLRGAGRAGAEGGTWPVCPGPPCLAPVLRCSLPVPQHLVFPFFCGVQCTRSPAGAERRPFHCRSNRAGCSCHAPRGLTERHTATGTGTAWQPCAWP